MSKYIPKPYMYINLILSTFAYTHRGGVPREHAEITILGTDDTAVFL